MTLQEQFPLSPRKFWKKMLSGSSRRGYYRRGGPLSALIVVLISVVYAYQLFNSVPSGNSALPAVQYQMDNLILLVVGAVVVIFVLYIIKAIYVSAYIRRYFYDASDSFITIRKGVFTPQEIHVQWGKVQDVYVDQDLLDRMLGLYDVHLASATATSGMEAHIDGIDRVTADGLKSFLLTHVTNANTPSPSSDMQQNASVAQSVSSTQFLQNQTVSSETYPISGAWIGQKITGALLGSAILGFFVPLIIAIFPYPSNVPGPTISLQATYGISSRELTGIGLAVFIVLFAFIALYSILWRASYSFAFLPEYITMKTGIVTKREVHVAYRTVQDVVVSQTFFGRMFGIADFAIQNAAAGAGMNTLASFSNGITIPGQALSRANELSDIVKRVALTKNPNPTGL